MRALHLLQLAAVGLCGAGLELPSQCSQPPRQPPASQVVDEQPELLRAEMLRAEFERELEAWKLRLQEVRGLRERKALRGEHPAIAFAGRFETLATEGELPALTWLLEHLDDVSPRGEARSERRLALYEQLIAGFAGRPGYVAAVNSMLGDRSLQREQEQGTPERLCRRAIERAADPSTSDGLRLGLAGYLSRSREEDDVQRGLALLEGVIEAECLQEHELEEARELRFTLLHLRVGGEAPDFEGRTVDGAPVRLSDQRGKVVVLNFFGFW